MDKLTSGAIKTIHGEHDGVTDYQAFLQVNKKKLIVLILRYLGH